MRQANCQCPTCRSDRRANKIVFGLITLAILSFIIALATLFSIGTATTLAHNYPITLCHATGSATNPYVKITISHHARDAAHIDRTTGRYHGQNNGTFDYEIAEDDSCATPTPTPVPTPTPQPSPSSSATTAPSPTPTASSPNSPSTSAAPTPVSPPSSAAPAGTSSVPTSLPNTAVQTESVPQALLIGLGVFLAAMGILFIIDSIVGRHR